MDDKKAFIEKWSPEISGFCLEAFARDEHERLDLVKKANFMLKQLRRVREMLGRIYDDINSQSPSNNGKLEVKR